MQTKPRPRPAYLNARTLEPGRLAKVTFGVKVYFDNQIVYEAILRNKKWNKYGTIHDSKVC